MVIYKKWSEMKNTGKKLFECLEMCCKGAFCFLFLMSVFIVLFFEFSNSPSASAVATQSTLTISTTTHNLTLTVLPTSSGTFSSSANNTINVTTDNFTGYTLKVASDETTSLVNEYDDEIQSISSAIDETTFSSGANYINKWGYKPSQYITTNNNVDTVVQNTNYLPAPSLAGDLIAKTSAANSSTDSYTISFGTKVGYGITPGSYTYSYNIIVIANTIVYNVTYDENTNETVASMPSPNPQVLTIAGGTSAANSYAALSNSIPTMTSDDMSFGGWCDVATTINSVTGNYECSGTTYQPGDDYPIDQTVDGTNITLYAIWLDDPFPMVWSQMGKCIFDGAEDTNNGLITGSECQDYVTDRFIDTRVALYGTDNYNKDYEVHFTIDRYVGNEQPDIQSTIFNDKLSSSVEISPYGGKSPGIVVRRSGGSNIEIKSTYTTTPLDGQRYISKTGANAYAGTDVSIFRIDGVMYTSVDNGPLIELQDMRNPVFNQQFGLSAWFGAYPNNVVCTENCTAAKRYFEGELSNMYIKLGDFDTSNLHVITLDANGGVLADGSTLLIMDGNAIGNSIADPTRTNWLFDGWLDESDHLVTAATVPDSDETYTAQWTKTVTLATITNSSITVDVGDTETINVSNSAELEPYTFESSNSTVASVDSSTGLVTGLAAGTATITMTGTRSGDTKTITVNVIGGSSTVTFDTDGGYGVADIVVGSGATLSEIPYTEKPGYVLEGWYTGTNGTGTKLDSSTAITNDITYHAYWIQGDFVCKVATSLHKEPCAQTGSNGCLGSGFSALQDIEYGHLVDSSSAVSPGAAYNCDVDYDGVFDDTTERFYYFGTENGNAKLIHYANMGNTGIVYADAIAALPNYALDQQNPSIPVWDNPNLVIHTTGDYAGKAARFMTYPEITNGLWDGTSTNIRPNSRSSLYLFEKSAFANTNITDGIWLEKTSDTVKNRIQTRSRGLTHGNTSTNAPRATIDIPDAFLEKYFVMPADYTITFDPQNATNPFTETITPGSALGAAYPSTDPTYTDYVFQGWYDAPAGGNLITDLTVPGGNRTYYAQWKGSVALAQIENPSIIVAEGANVTLQVTNSADLEGFTFTSSDTSVATINSSTGLITGVSAGSTTINLVGTESHTTASAVATVTVADPSMIYTVYFDPDNGTPASSVSIIAGNALGSHMPSTNPTYAGHAFQRWYDPLDNNATITSSTTPSANNTTYYAEWKLDVQQAVISNNDLTVTVGSQLTIGVSNSAALESYTFSSSNTNYATVDTNTGVVTGVGVGTVNIIMTGVQSNLTKAISVDVVAAPAQQYTVTFEYNDSIPQTTETVDDGDAIGNRLPNPTRTNYKFFGWYTDDGTFYEEVTPATVVEGDITYYAKWVEDTASFPIVWSETNACTFTGTSNVSGDYCSASNKTLRYINTAVQLFTQANYEKDFEVGFTIVEYDPSANNNQATFVNSKLEDSSSNYPGFVVRRYTNYDTIEITAKWKGNNGVSQQFTASSVKTVKVVRRVEDINGVNNINLYYSINGGALTPLQDITNVTRVYFDTNVWFGMSVTSNGVTTQRPLVGTLTDMYVKLGADTDYAIDFNPNGGSFANSSDSSRTITIGSQLGQLPTPIPPSNNYTFDAWYDESVTPAVAVSASTYPDGNKTYVAHYIYSSTTSPVQFDVSNTATRGYNTIVTGYLPQITTFNEDTTTVDSSHPLIPSIDYSTWGVAKSTYHSALQNNFETNNCMLMPSEDSQIDWGGNHTVNCSKPDIYDTGMGEALNVYLYDTSNSTVGAQVDYAHADDGKIRNMIPGQSYYWEVASDTTKYGVVTATSVNDRRWIDAGTIWNVRDLGGLPVTYTDGNNQTVNGTLEYGKLFRGARLGNNGDNITALMDLGVDKQYDLADPNELDDVKFGSLITGTNPAEYYPGIYVNDPVKHYNFDYGTAGYAQTRKAVTDAMNDIIAGNTIYFHCRQGADRTGTLAYLLEGLLGVPDEYRYQDYELTSVAGLNDRTRYYAIKNANDNNTGYYKFMYMMGYVLTNQDIYEWYTADTSDTDADDRIADFRAAMIATTPSQPQNNNNSNNLEPESLPADNDTQSINNVESNNNNLDSTISSGADSTYVAPLGVTETSVITSNDSTPSNPSSSNNLALGVAAAALAGASVVTFSSYYKKRSE